MDILDRARREGTPLIDGEFATFVWEGPEAPWLAADFNEWGSREIRLEPITPGVSARSVRLPPDAYVEYSFALRNQRLLDRLNPHAIGNGLGATNNYFLMPEAARADLATPAPGIPRGTVTRHIVEDPWLLVGGKRIIHLYHPPVAEPVPLLVVLDGREYLNRARLPAIVDNLIAQGKIPPIAMAFEKHGGRARFIEYDCSEATLSFLMRDLLSLARQHLNLIDASSSPGVHGIVGASMGGLMSLYAGLRAPHIFGRVLSQSGAFFYEQHFHSVAFDLVWHGPVRPIKVWMDVGLYEGLLGNVRRMHEALQKREYDVRYREYPGGHNYMAWRLDLPRALEFLFDGSDAGAPEDS